MPENHHLFPCNNGCKGYHPDREPEWQTSHILLRYHRVGIKAGMHSEKGGRDNNSRGVTPSRSLVMLPAPQQPTAQAAIEQPAVVKYPQQRLLGVAGHGDGVKTGLALAIAVHLIEQGMRQALGDKVGDDQHIRLGR